MTSPPSMPMTAAINARCIHWRVPSLSQKVRASCWWWPTSSLRIIGTFNHLMVLKLLASCSRLVKGRMGTIPTSALFSMLKKRLEFFKSTTLMMIMSWSSTMQRHMSNEQIMHSQPNVCLKIPYPHGESLSLSRTTMALLCAILMASCRRWRSPWNLDTLPMETHNHSIFLMDMRRWAGSKEWPRFFGSEDLKPNLNCKPNTKGSIVCLVKLGAAAVNSSTTNPTSSRSNQSLRWPAVQRVSKCCFCWSSIVNSISLSKCGGMQSACIVNSPFHQRSPTSRRMSLQLLTSVTPYDVPVSWLAHIVTSSQVNFTLTGMQDSLGNSWTCTKRISQANKQPGQPRSIMAIMLFQNRYSPSYNWLLSTSHCCISHSKVNMRTCNLSIVTYLCILTTTHTW